MICNRSATSSRNPVSLVRVATLIGLSWLCLLWLGGTGLRGQQVTDATGVGVPAELSPQGDAAHPNRLALETSPYLLLHAHNPVDWYPWGEAALAKAKAENKLIFLSIGYSSCHWCHVMERESFVDEEIAKYLNDHYVCIKVDREERPDVDAIYMLAVQAVTGRGGWPLSVFLTPEAKPFFGGTYFPARDGDRNTPMGFLTILNRVQQLWRDRPEIVQRDGDKLTELIRVQFASQPKAEPLEIEQGLLDQVEQRLIAEFDPVYGGFGFAQDNPQMPKFPEPCNLAFLVYRAGNGASSKALEMLRKSLDHMARGGIYDHVGGGFHRYSTDRRWEIPHFEKMLYDNGQLLSIYAEAYQLTHNEAYRRIVDETIVCLMRDFRAPDGAFFAALDAESEGEEGLYYAWRREEIEAALDPAVYAPFADHYGLRAPPNFEARHVLRVAEDLESPPADPTQDTTELRTLLNNANQRLLAIRQQRVAPRCDTKILTSWNGLTIRGLADAGRILKEPRYIAAAADAAQFVWQNLRRDDGRLWRTHTAGKPQLNAYLDDYAFFAAGLLALHQATNDDHWRQQAVAILETQQSLFGDTEHGAYFFTASDHEALIARGKHFADGALPAGNSLAAWNLAYLARQDRAEPGFDAGARRTIQAASSLWHSTPQAMPQLAAVVGELLDNH